MHLCDMNSNLISDFEPKMLKEIRRSREIVRSTHISRRALFSDAKMHPCVEYRDFGDRINVSHRIIKHQSDYVSTAVRGVELEVDAPFDGVLSIWFVDPNTYDLNNVDFYEHSAFFHTKDVPSRVRYITTDDFSHTPKSSQQYEYEPEYRRYRHYIDLSAFPIIGKNILVVVESLNRPGHQNKSLIVSPHCVDVSAGSLYKGVPENLPEEMILTEFDLKLPRSCGEWMKIVRL